MRLGSILAIKGVPSPNKLANVLSVYAFLSMKKDTDNSFLLPGEVWKDIIDPQHFVTSIQWFITELFGIKRDPMVFVYRELTILRLHLDSSTCPGLAFDQPLLNLLHWKKCSTHIPLFYHQGQQRLRITGVAPFHNYNATGNKINSSLSEWVFGVDQRFPSGVMTLINAFWNNIPC